MNAHVVFKFYVNKFWKEKYKILKIVQFFSPDFRVDRELVVKGQNVEKIYKKSRPCFSGFCPRYVYR